MDKCREEFEKQRYWIGLFRTGVDFDVTLGEFGRYISNGTISTDAMDLESFNEKWEAWANCWQHQQAKVYSLEEHVEKLQEEFAEDERFLKEQIQQKDLKISNLEYQQGMDKELIQSLQSKSEKLLKRVDALKTLTTSWISEAESDSSLSSEDWVSNVLNRCAEELEQALKGEKG